MSTPARLLIVGEVCPDIVVSAVPTQGTRLRFGQAEDLVGATTMTLGSSAGITACAAARAGSAVRLCAVRGDDLFGSACMAWLADRGVDTAAVRVVPGERTGSSVILVRADDATDREILTDLGVMTDLRAQEVTDELLTSSTHLHIASFFLHLAAREELWERMRRARELGLTTSLDTNDDPEREWRAGAQQAIETADILFVNDSEARGLAGADPDEPVASVIARLLARMPDHPQDRRFPAVVHKSGAAGATVHCRHRRISVAAPAVDTVDTVGAGDTLAGTALAALLGGADWPQALALAVAAGSLSTMAAGGVAGQQTPQAVEALAASLTAHTTLTPPEDSR